MILQRRMAQDSQWRTVAVFSPADLQTVYAAAAALSSVSEVRWRVLGEGERLLSIFDGGRWRNDPGALAPSLWWDGPRAADDTMPAPLDGFPSTIPTHRQW